MPNDKLFDIATSLLQDINETYVRTGKEQGEVPALEMALLKKQVISFYEIVLKLEKEYRDEGAAGKVSSHIAELREEVKQMSEHEPQAFRHQQPEPSGYEQPPVYEPSVPEPPSTPESDFTDAQADTEDKTPQEEAEPAQETVPDSTAPREAPVNQEEEKPEEELPQKIQDEEKPDLPPETEESAPAEPIMAESPENEKTKKEAAEKEKSAKDAAPAKEPEQEPASRQSLNERFAGRTALHQRLGKSQPGMADKFKLTPIADLKSAISLNKKIAFINDLFKGNQKEYRKTIDFLNKSGNYSEARFYLQSELKPKYDWKDSDPLYLELQELVQRKFL
ncbi:MAG: hypothetical protein WD077_04995 [Bacteroidia bacterium]